MINDESDSSAGATRRDANPIEPSRVPHSSTRRPRAIPIDRATRAWFFSARIRRGIASSRTPRSSGTGARRRGFGLGFDVVARRRVERTLARVLRQMYSLDKGAANDPRARAM